MTESDSQPIVRDNYYCVTCKVEHDPDDRSGAFWRKHLNHQIAKPGDPAPE